MKKALKTILLMALFCLVLTGCKVKQQVSVVVNPDNSVTLQLLTAMDKESIQEAMRMQTAESGEESGEDSGEEIAEEKVFTEEEMWEFIESSQGETEEGFTSERYSDDEFMGTVMTSEIKNINELVLKQSSSKADLSDVSQGLFQKNGNEYAIHMPIEDTAEEDVEEGNVYDFILTLPMAAKSNNATSVSEDGLTYTWNLLEAESIDVTFELSNDNSEEAKVEENTSKISMPVIVGCVAAVVVIILVIVLVSKKKES